MSQHLREAREQKGLTQAAMADLIGRDQSAVSRYENGARPEIDILPIYAKALGLSVEEVLFGPAPVVEPELQRAG